MFRFLDVICSATRAISAKGLNARPARNQPTGTEIAISLGIYAIGSLLVTILYKVAISVKKEAAA